MPITEMELQLRESWEKMKEEKRSQILELENRVKSALDEFPNKTEAVIRGTLKETADVIDAYIAFLKAQPTPVPLKPLRFMSIKYYTALSGIFPVALSLESGEGSVELSEIGSNEKEVFKAAFKVVNAKYTYQEFARALSSLKDNKFPRKAMRGNETFKNDPNTTFNKPIMAGYQFLTTAGTGVGWFTRNYLARNGEIAPPKEQLALGNKNEKYLEATETGLARVTKIAPQALIVGVKTGVSWRVIPVSKLPLLMMEMKLLAESFN